ncbi:hypothetical protein ACF0H5_011904 [Mactra antiquata]
MIKYYDFFVTLVLYVSVAALIKNALFCLGVYNFWIKMSLAAENGVVRMLSIMIITARLISGYTETGQCKNYEVITCGGIDQSWSVCEPRKSNVLYILSAHLDVRYETRNCRKYGTPINFGLTFNGLRLWTVNGCYGSFLLCLEIDPTDQDNNTNVENNQSSEVNGIHGNYFQKKEATTTINNIYFSDYYDNTYEVDDDEDDDDDDDNDKIDDGDYYDVDNDDNDDYDGNGADYTFYHDEYESTSGVIINGNTDTVKAENNNNETDVATTTENVILTEEHVKEKSSAVKYILMGGIITGGLIIVVLICVITYLCTCSDGYEEASKKDAANNKGYNTKYFRQKKWSIAPLMSDCSRSVSVTSSTTPASPVSTEDDYKNVYDFIPADLARSNNNTLIKRDTRIPTVPVLRIVDETGDSNKPHDYFVLIADTTKSDSNIETSANVNSEEENEYDHLVHNPIKVIPDTSIYNHIDILTTSSQNENRDSANLSNEERNSATMSNENRNSANVSNEKRNSATMSNENRNSANVSNEKRNSAYMSNENRNIGNLSNENRNSANMSNEKRNSAYMSNENRNIGNLSNENRNSANMSNEKRNSAYMSNENRNIGSLSNVKRSSANLSNENRSSVNLSNDN